jgi:hypothetical protein
VDKHIRLKTYPANPAKGFEGVKNPLPDGENPCRVGYPAPTRQNPAKPGTPPLAGYLPGTAGYLSGELPGTGFADEEGYKPFFRGRTCRVLPGTCRVRYPARILPMGKGEIPPLRGTCRVCRVGLQGGSDAD